MILATALIVILSGFMSHIFVNGNQKGHEDQNSIQAFIKRFFGLKESLSSGDRDKLAVKDYDKRFLVDQESGEVKTKKEIGSVTIAEEHAVDEEEVEEGGGENKVLLSEKHGSLPQQADDTSNNNENKANDMMKKGDDEEGFGHEGKNVESAVVVNEEGEIVSIPILSSGADSVGKGGSSSKCISSADCDELDFLCAPYKKKKISRCRKGKEFSKKCKSDQECYSEHCDALSEQCVCPTAESCLLGCNGSADRGAPCLRVENISPINVDVCSLTAYALKQKSKGGRRTRRTSSSRVDLFDIGGRHSDVYTNLDRVIRKSNDECFIVEPFKTQNLLYPPGFVQASMKMSEEDMKGFFGQVSVKGLKRSLKDMLGLQIFINGNWVAHVEEQDVTLPIKKAKGTKTPKVNLLSDEKEDEDEEVSFALEEEEEEEEEASGGRNSSSTDTTSIKHFKKKNQTWEVVKYIYPRVSISWENLKDVVQSRGSRQKMLVVEVLETKKLDFDIPTEMGIEFVGNGISESILSVVGDLEILGRASFLDMTVTFQHGSLLTNGPTFFKASRIVDINRCPYSFTEYNGKCFLVSDFIEQADDAAGFCESFDRASIATYRDAIDFVLSDEGTLKGNTRAWIRPKSSSCTAIGSDGTLFESDTQSCDDYIKVLCSASLKKPIYGNTFTSYFTDQNVGTYKQDFYKRIVDKDRLPFQLGGTVSIAQGDLENQDFNFDEPVRAIFIVPDSRPVAIGMEISLARGDLSELEIAFDTYNMTQMHGSLWPVDNETLSLPTKFQVHTKADLCIKNIDLKVYNETGHSSIFASFPATLFADCLDYNVCSADDELSCGRSLMYYDKDLECAKLDVGSSIIPQDFSIDLMSLRCARLTTWTHEHLGSPFFIEAKLASVNDIIIAKEILGDKHEYSYSGDISSVLLDESTVLPTDFEVTGEGILERFQITRYGKIISNVDISHMWDCINMCEALGYPSGILFHANNVTSLQLQLIDAVECRKLELVLTEKGDGREVCTSPSYEVSSLTEVLAALQDIRLPQNPYRTLMLNVTENLVEDLNITITVQKNRGLILYRDLDTFLDAFGIENSLFVVESFGELYLNDFLINGTSQIDTAAESETTIAGCEIDTNNVDRFFFSNAGTLEIFSTSILGTTIVQNIGDGRINHMYVGYFDESTIVNEADESIIRLSRTTFYEEFSMNRVNWVNFTLDFLGSLELPDAKRYYESLDDESDDRCTGVDSPDKVITGFDENKCRQACEDEFICSGVITYFSDETPMCGLCLREEQCAFDCSSFGGGAYYVAGSSFSYSKVKACPFISRPFKMVEGTTLEECKLFCSYFRPCEGFRVTPNNSCELIADLDFAETCSTIDEEFVYIPYVESTKSSFKNVYGNLFDSEPIATHNGYSLSECATICQKTMSCVSFQLSSDVCILFNRRDYEFTGENNGLHLYIDDVFPKKRYMIYASCYLVDSYESYNIKSVKRCRDICNGDYSCGGFAFRPLQTLYDDNCELYNSTSLVNRVFGPDLGCHEQPRRRFPKDGLESSLLDIPHSNVDEYIVSSDGAVIDKVHDISKGISKGLKSSKSTKTSSPSQSLEPSMSPSNVPSTDPSVSPSDLPSSEPSLNPSVSVLPSVVPSGKPSVTSSPSMTPSVSNEPSVTPSISVRPSQVSETYDLYLAFVEEVYTESSGRSFKTVETFTEVDEEECKTLCFYNKDCIVLKVEGGTCMLGELQDLQVRNQNIESSYMILDNKESDIESRYLSTNACFTGEKLEDVDFVVEETFGYSRMPRTCVVPDSNSAVSSIQSPAECGLECSRNDSCFGFMFYIDYSGSKNRDKFGSCSYITSTFDLGTCDGVENNADLYLRSDVGASCQASCNIHYLCSSFVFDQGRCDLYSDIALFRESECVKPEQVNIGLSYRSRDGLVAASNQCLVEYEDLRESGCFDFTSSQISIERNMKNMTPHLCQQHCKHLGEEMYAVRNGTDCMCGSANMLELPVAENTTTSCNVACEGDSSQTCGGSIFANVGATGLPLFGLTLAQCKRECFRSYECEALVFDDSGTRSECNLRSRGEFETCSEKNTISYIESLEHYYSIPTTSFIGSYSILNTTTELKQDCQKLCDSYDACEAIKYDIIANISNCALLGGDVVRLEEGDIAQGVEVANDVNLYTRGFSSVNMTLITEIPTTFDLDECRTLCEQHVECGSLDFVSPSCRLYNKNDFVDIRSPDSNSHYIAYSYFVDPGQEFKGTNNLCIDDTDEFLQKRMTTQSEYDCADYCNSIRECSMFSYSSNTTTCILYDSMSSLTSNCFDDDVSTFVMFTRGKFAPQINACLKDEESLDSISFHLKNPLECMALCDKWFNCRSFRSNEISGECTLYESEQYSTAGCPDSLEGLLFLYASDHYFTRLDENFCVGTEPITSIDDTPIEACKTICSRHGNCLSFEHTQSGACFLYSSADFTNCTKQEGKDLYISYEDTVDPESRFVFNQLNSCFSINFTVESPVEGVNDELSCKEYCENDESCAGIQIMDLDSCYSISFEKFTDTAILDADECDKAFLKTKLNPYKKTANTCLQQRIDFEKGKLLDMEVYECMNLCTLHPLCRYFIYGEDPRKLTPELRECILFEAQGREVDDCDGQYKEYDDTYADLAAYVNGRTFVDQITWFGEPETEFAKLSGISYQECASVCDSVPSCSAFTHTWNYRKYPLLSRSVLFTKTRMASLDFDQYNNRAEYLAFDLDSKRLVLKAAESDDDVRAQQISMESTSIDTTTTKLKMKFWSSSGQCLSGGSNAQTFTSGIPGDNHTLDTIMNHFDGSEPSCLTLGISDCSDDDVLLFDNFLDYGFEEPINFSWNAGCIRLQREFEDSVHYIGNGDIFVPVKVVCKPPLESIDQCEYSTSSSPSLSKSPSASDRPKVSQNPPAVPSDSWKPTQFSQCQEVQGTFCRNLPNETLSVPYDTVITREECKQSTKTCDENKCIIETTITTYECLHIQKEVKDLVVEMHEFFDNKCPSNAGNVNLFSSSYSGVGCSFDEESASFPSQEFTYASDAVILQNDGSGDCLSSDLKLGGCSETTEWVHLFTSGHIYYTDDNDDMKCLSRDASGTGVEIRNCERNDSNQAWIYDVDEGMITKASNPEFCLIGVGIEAVGLGNCESKLAKWSRYEECRLNTRTTTKKMKLESVRDPGLCLSTNSSYLASLAPCGDTGNEWIYNYNGNNATLIQGDNENFCMGRRLDDGLYNETCNSSNVCKKPENFPSGLVPCKEVVWSRQVLAGEENNIFQWSMINFRNGEKLGPDYCLQAPTGTKQELCNDASSLSSAQTWRAYVDNAPIDATEISVKPSATLQIVTDPEVLFQFYLFSKEGKSSRILRSRVAGLIRDVERLKKLIEFLLVITQEAYALVDTIQEPIGKIDDKMQTGERTFSIFNKLLIPFEYIPYVGKALKASRLKPITGQVAKHMKKGQNVLEKADEKVQQMYEPLDSFTELLERIEEKLPLVYALNKFVDIITRSSFCALREDKQNHYDVTQIIINLLITKVNISTNLIEDLKNPLSFMNSFKADFAKYIKAPIRVIEKLLDPFFKVMNALSFIEFIATLKIPIPHVKIKFGWKCKIFICWPTFDVKYDPINFTLEQVGKVVKKIIDAIKSIPIIGEIISFVEDAVESVLAAIFKFIGVELPSWKIDFPFIDRLKQRAREAAEKAEEFMEHFENILNLDGKFSSLVETLIEPMLDIIPTIDLGCDGDETEIFQCSMEKLGINVDFNLDNEISGIDMNGVSLLPDVSVMNILGDFLEDAQEIEDKISSFLEDDAIECRQYETVSLDMVNQILKPLNISTDDLPMAICPLTFQICTDLVLPQLEAFAAYMSNKFEESFRRRNRNLEMKHDESSSGLCSPNIDGVPYNWGLSITFTRPEFDLKIIPGTDIDFIKKIKSNFFDFYKKASIQIAHVGLPTELTLAFGCEDGEMQLLLETSPMIEIDFNSRYLESRSYKESKYISFPRTWSPTTKFRPSEDAIRTLGYLQGNDPDLDKFNKEMKMIEILNKILCHLDYLLVNEKVGAENVLDATTKFSREIRKRKLDDTRKGSTIREIIKAWLAQYELDFAKPKKNSIAPSDTPSISAVPSDIPSDQPSDQPSDTPSDQPSDTPSDQPSDQPSKQPSDQPSKQPSDQPSDTPSDQPSKQPSDQPSKQPSDQPSKQPSDQPSKQPSDQPSDSGPPTSTDTRRALHVYDEIDSFAHRDLSFKHLPFNAIDIIKLNLGTEIAKIGDWEVFEKILSDLQIEAYKKRKEKRKSAKIAGSINAFNSKFPEDVFERQEHCKNLYGYDISKPEGIKDKAVKFKENFRENSFEYLKEVGKSITYSPTNFFAGGTLPYKKLRRTIDFGLMDKHDSYFGIFFMLGEILLNFPYLFVNFFSSLDERASNDATTSPGQPTSSPSPSGKPSVLPSGLPSGFPSSSPSISLLPSSLPSSSPSPTTAKDEAWKNFLILVLTLFPAISIETLIESFNYFTRKKPAPLPLRQLESVFNIIGSGIEPQRPLAEQEVRVLTPIQAFSISVNLLSSENKGGTLTGRQQTQYCNGRFCISMLPDISEIIVEEKD
ncbi:hypothetical protein CTEN210_00602 [Chaetoceros tenuissimus]|uniref:Calmodulin n=1 Tax=Chaetoceros tenuissimus TaxID=426638 RepID=A0AAD3CEG2_9STRA|nr:hypothetical protein CTEN210_00602 [Chaetoceros tenuissimus]